MSVFKESNGGLIELLRPLNRLITGGPPEDEKTRSAFDLANSVRDEILSKQNGCPALQLMLKDHPHFPESFVLYDAETRTKSVKRFTEGQVRKFQKQIRKLLSATRAIIELTPDLEWEGGMRWWEKLYDYYSAAYSRYEIPYRVLPWPDRKRRKIKYIRYASVGGLDELYMAVFSTFAFRVTSEGESCIDDCRYCGQPHIMPRPNTEYCSKQCRGVKNMGDTRLRKTTILA